MAEILRCPNCNAQIHSVADGKILKCEYCDTELITDNNTQNFPALINDFSAQVNHYINTGIYVEETKKWKKSFHQKLIIQSAMTAFFGVLMEADASGIGVITFLIATIYSFIQPSRLSKDKPLSPKPQKNNKFLDFMKIYPAFAGTFWGGMILMAILLSINP
ncbi:MAG: hypothetical protein K2K89_07090 [Ruminococcus sp.]|nr:hypothetical protein [Ruminococcus sp.]